MRRNRIQRTEKENIGLKIMISSFFKHSLLTPNPYTLFSSLLLTAYCVQLISGNRGERIAESGQRIGCREERIKEKKWGVSEKMIIFLRRILFSNLYTLFSSLLLTAYSVRLTAYNFRLVI